MKCLSQEEIEANLRQAGVNPTAQRIAICQFVLCDADHPTAEDVKAWADKNFPKMSMATVYNTLGTLVNAGLLKEFKFPHTGKVIYDNNLTKHYHFYDEGTGMLTDIPSDQIDVKSPLFKSLKITEIDVVIRGRKGRNF